MASDFFGVLLQELGQTMDLPNLHPDRNNSCLIKLKKGISIRLEVDASGQYLILGSDLGDVPSGRYRETLFVAALKSNGLSAVHNGVFAYSRKLNHLIIFEMLALSGLNVDRLITVMTPFIEKAVIWKNALVKEEIPVIIAEATSHSPSGLFGMRR